MDLDKWRSINKTIFGRDYSEKIKFDKSFLFTDKVYIKDTNRYRDLYNGNLVYAIPDVKGYLHTKFVILCYENKYVFILSTKNINGNGNYDYILPILFEQEENATNGKEVAGYLDYLINCTKDQSLIPEELKTHVKNIKNYQISSSIENFGAGLFEFAYDEKRFSREMIRKIRDSSKIVSPYLDEFGIETLSKNVKILAYPQQIQKIFENAQGISFRVGKGRYRDGQLIAQRKYHAKIYFRWYEENECGHLIVGSANLTKAAQEKHCEMLLELKTSDKNVYCSKEVFFDDEEWTEEYDSGKDYSVLVDEDEFDDEDPATILSNNSRIYVNKKGEDGFKIHVVSDNLNKDEEWGPTYDVASYYVENERRQMLHIDESIYAESCYTDNIPEALSYNEYIKLIEDRKALLQKESDMSVLTGRKPGNLIGAGEKKEKEQKGMALESIPCLFETLFRNLEKRKGDGIEVSERMIIDELKDIRNSLYDKQWIEQIDIMIKNLEKTYE